MILKAKICKLLTFLHQGRSINFMTNEGAVNLPQDKINFINDTHQKELQYWKKEALKEGLN